MLDKKYDLRGSAVSSVILVDSHTESIHFYTKSGNQIRHHQAACEMSAFDQDFFARFDTVIQQFRQNTPGVDLQKSAIILPDRLFMTDTVKIPMIHRRAMRHSLNLAIAAVYQNAAELDIKTNCIQKNKQYATYSLVGIRRDILSMLHKTCGQQNVGISSVDFAANAAANGAIAANTKLKGETFLLLDIKEDDSRFAFVTKGILSGYYHLPFGYREQLSACLTEEDVYENFRIFMRWSLDLIRNNPDLVSTSQTQTVYVNLPDQYQHLFARANAQDNGQNVAFSPLLAEDASESIRSNLDLYGGFCGNCNKQTTF